MRLGIFFFSHITKQLQENQDLHYIMMWLHDSFTDLPTYILTFHVHKPLEISVPFALACIYYCPAGNY